MWKILFIVFFWVIAVLCFNLRSFTCLFTARQSPNRRRDVSRYAAFRLRHLVLKFAALFLNVCFGAAKMYIPSGATATMISWLSVPSQSKDLLRRLSRIDFCRQWMEQLQSDVVTSSDSYGAVRGVDCVRNCKIRQTQQLCLETGTGAAERFESFQSKAQRLPKP